MREVVVGFSRPSKWKLAAWIIMLFERTNFSHCYVQFSSLTYERELVYQASGTKVNFVGSIHFRNEVTIVEQYSVPLSDDTYKKVMQFCIDHAGESYGLAHLFGILYVRVMGWFGKRVKNPWATAESWVCSELVGYMLRELCGLHIQGDLDVAGPRGIEEFLRKTPGVHPLPPLQQKRGSVP